MIDWIKNLFKKDIAPEHRKEDHVISEPVLTLAELWKTDKKRFHFDYEYPYIYEIYAGMNLQGMNITCNMTVVDKYTEECFKFGLNLSPIVIKNIWSTYWQKKFGHRVYPVLGYRVYSHPSWMSCDEAKYLCDLVTPYFKERVERYSKLVDYRKDRKVEAGKRQTERSKQEERQRLVNLYAKDS